MKEMSIGHKKIGEKHPPFVIAEIGNNHDGSLSTAKEYIAACAKAGADAAKFQLFTAQTLLNPEVLNEAEEWVKHPAWELITELALPPSWLPELVACCQDHHILFTCTPFSEEAVQLLEDVDIPFYKVGSGELTHRLLLERIAATRKLVVLSTGMGNMEEVKQAVQWLKDGGSTEIIVLHCVSNYPPKDEDAHLRTIITLKNELQTVVGFSDHSAASALCSAAVALGASVFEKHVTFDRRLKGPDHPFALEVDELAQLVVDVNRVHKALGNESKESVAQEEEMKIHARRGVYALKDLQEGELLTKDDIAIVRPLLPNHLSASEVKQRIGQKLTSEVKVNRPLK